LKITEQLDALLTLSTKPERYLYAPRVLAAIITAPMTWSSSPVRATRCRPCTPWPTG
jgi:phospholipid/cholesterol/gamma-HCH transport system permease protein